MALRSGYYGLKTKILNKVNKWDQIVFPRDEQEKLGAKNLLPNTASSSGIFTVNADGTITATGSTSSSAVYIRPYIFEAGTLPSGKYILSGCPDGGGETKWEIQLYNTTTSHADAHNYGGDTEITIDATKRYGVLCYVRANQTVSGLTFKPMIRLATDKNNTYVPYAMTNRDLTLSAADQKTVINAIITAATGAADFAAFKTAMGAITPVTRSLSKEASPEDVSEVIEEEKPVTKKTTKKTVKEGE